MEGTTGKAQVAPAGRVGRDQVRSTAALVEETPLLREMIDAVPDPLLLLNETRQVVAANRTLLRLLGREAEAVLGKRPGEIMGCAYWPQGPDGCGSTPHCLTCGALDAVLKSRDHNTQVTRECRLSLETALDGGAIDLRVTASPFEVLPLKLTLCVLEDISQQKRLEVLTRTFFHDVLNTAGGIRGFAHLIEDDLAANAPARDEAHQLGCLTDRLIDEIECHRDLTRAESGEFVVEPRPVRTIELLRELAALYSAHEVSVGREIVFGLCWNGSLLIDPRLLARVLGNMIKNALEATPQGDRVMLECEQLGREVAFHVHNPTVMPEEVRLQIFHRSFSTKGEPGRGIGTYSIKLFGETYLGGRVSFTSGEPDGTRFTIVVPKVRFAAPCEVA